ncbi:hypothetical protein SBRCBS47491_004531 [Sporothrix bragantina]|uniref:Carboxyphosphonoenolpyruvate phosphonomutase n=1 Tax=Sporothrix bragantina TaxID=671064 RepID=A0ABP0BP78_9PEZI
MAHAEEKHTPFRPAVAILREKLADPDKVVVCPGIFDGYTARIALDAGFDAIYMTGAGTAASVLGQPDLGIISLPEVAGHAGMIASLNRNVPVIADADTGFGSSLAVARAYLVRIKADVRARKECGRDIVIIARTDALQSLGLDEAFRRLKAAQAQASRELVPIPCLLNTVGGGVTPAVDAAEAKIMGFKIVLWPILSLTYTYSAVKAAMRELKETDYVDPTPNGQGGIKEVFEVCGIEKAAAFDCGVGGDSMNGGFF